MNNRNETRTSLIRKISIIVFLGFIYALAALNLAAPKYTYSENENRYLSGFPSLSFSGLLDGHFDTDFEYWFTDHFAARSSWICVKAKTVQLAGSIENNGVYFGKNGRLIRQFLPGNDRLFRAGISALRDFSEENDFHLNILLIPEASFGEKDSLPYGAFNINEKELVETVKDECSGQTVIDVSDILQKTENTYFHTDHHWNERGALLAYEAICREVLHKEPVDFRFEKVSSSFRGTMYSRSGAFWTKPDDLYRIDPVPGIDVTAEYEDGKRTDSLYDDKKLEEKDKYAYYLGGNHAAVHIRTDAGSGRSAVIIKDSFAQILIPFLAAEYSDIMVYDLRYYHEPVSEAVTDKANTDIYVIYSTDSFMNDSSLSALW